jgi:hypothetical protein
MRCCSNSPRCEFTGVLRKSHCQHIPGQVHSCWHVSLGNQLAVMYGGGAGHPTGHLKSSALVKTFLVLFVTDEASWNKGSAMKYA